MKRRHAVLFRALCWVLLGLASPAAFAQANAPQEDPRLAAQEKEACTRNLKLIYEAIQAYQLDHKDIPNWLSDLVPQYISDANVLICPVCKRTGEIESSALADPKIPSSYLYEFCPLPLGKTESPNAPDKTRREWKRRQMGVVGSIVPLVRCRLHARYLNLAFDGRIYESLPAWENGLSNQVEVAELMPARIFAGESSVKAALAAPAPPPAYPPRDPRAFPGLINLAEYYNVPLAQPWYAGSSYSLSSLPSGLQVFARVGYDARGIVQLGGKMAAVRQFPARINGIPIHQKCERLHFLHAAAGATAADEGVLVGSYIVHFATNQMQLEIPIVYGRDVRDWSAAAGEKPGASGLTVAWSGESAAHPVRLFTTTWVNLVPGVEIESLDYVSTMNSAAPFLVAITAD